MIDTLEFRIHDLRLHLKLVEFLDRKTTGTGKTVTLRESEDDFSVEQKIIHKKYIQFHDTGNLHQVAHFNELKSSHYNIAYCIDYQRDFVRFNVSLPKYVYGVNILHYNTAPGSKAFSAYQHSTIEHNLSEAYDRLQHFLQKFFRVEFPSFAIHPEYVEINRLDLCYNQMFPDQASALDYLYQLKKIKKKYSRDSSNNSRDWKTSMTYVTKRYSFKIYHKGSEFKKNDAPKLRDLNEKQGAGFDVDVYQAFADRILRYEMTFRNSYMSYLHMNYVFRKDCEIWQAGVKLWKQDKAKRANFDNWNEFRRGLTAEEKKLIQYVNSFISKSKQLYLSGKSGVNRDFDKETDPARFWAWPDKKEDFWVPARFSRALFKQMCSRFTGLINQFQLEMAEDQQTILGRIERHNATIQNDRDKLKAAEIPRSSSLWKRTGTKVLPGKIKMVLELLQHSTMEEIAQSGMFCRKTWYNIRKQLEAFGVTENSLATPSTPTPLDLRSYNAEVMRHLRKFKNLSF
jgi:hypothetical protein